MSESKDKIMKAARFHKKGDPTTSEVLSVEEGVPIPEPKEGQILVQVKAASINPVDWKLMKGLVPMKQGPPVGSDVSGTIVKIGPNTTAPSSLKEGDDVYGDSIATRGSWGEYMVCPANVLSKKPSNISHAEAAALPLAGLTALQGLRNHGNFQAGQKVLIFGGSGGVGSLAVQMAKALGASEVYSTGSDVKAIKALGADFVVNYKEESLMDVLKGKEFDIVYDTIGGHEHWEVAQASLKKDGIFVTLVGDDSGSMVTDLVKAAWRAVKGKVLRMISGGLSYNLFLTDTSYAGLADDMTKMTELVESGKLKSILDGRKFELTTESIHSMVEASMGHRVKGKLILEVAK